MTPSAIPKLSAMIDQIPPALALVDAHRRTERMIFQPQASQNLRKLDVGVLFRQLAQLEGDPTRYFGVSRNRQGRSNRLSSIGNPLRENRTHKYPQSAQAIGQDQPRGE